MSDHVVAWLRELGAREIAHPGGTLLTHLERVEALLGSWGARPALRRAGLCHAFYGTDGFPTALLPLARRAELAAVIGDEAEEIVYAYAACDRAASYPTLACEEAAYRDRFTGRVDSPARGSGGTWRSCPRPTNSTSRGSIPPSVTHGEPNSAPCSSG
ncbi:hypothetical protein OG818_39560 [Streptomyces virginiae]|uniref:DUF6817 domain-containing protein n=1 Tax=Streptomyces virginiae TaxID=1961 RepID=UPI00224DD64F|nr:hypothetical protein [Streptomyces virginiae]MCX4721803.1 hypothetical protein [Streptomyces virginiae]